MPAIGLIASIFVNLFVASQKKKKLTQLNAPIDAPLAKTLKPSNVVLDSFVIFVVGILGAILFAMIYNVIFFGAPFHEDVNAPIMRMFGGIVLLPLIMPLYYVARKSDLKLGLDMLAITLYSVMAFSKFGCIFGGCCGGRQIGEIIFPSPIVESASIVAVVVLLVVCAIKLKNTGILFPLSTVLYCITRFPLEYFRYYPEGSREGNFLLGHTFWQVVTLLVLLACAAWAMIVFFKSKSDAKLAAE